MHERARKSRKEMKCIVPGRCFVNFAVFREFRGPGVFALMFEDSVVVLFGLPGLR
jgi:hypothetical protein